MIFFTVGIPSKHVDVDTVVIKQLKLATQTSVASLFTIRIMLCDYIRTLWCGIVCFKLINLIRNVIKKKK